MRNQSRAGAANRTPSVGTAAEMRRFRCAGRLLELIQLARVPSNDSIGHRCGIESNSSSPSSRGAAGWSTSDGEGGKSSADDGAPGGFGRSLGRPGSWGGQGSTCTGGACWPVGSGSFKPAGAGDSLVAAVVSGAIVPASSKAKSGGAGHRPATLESKIDSPPKGGENGWLSGGENK